MSPYSLMASNVQVQLESKARKTKKWHVPNYYVVKVPTEEVMMKGFEHSNLLHPFKSIIQFLVGDDDSVADDKVLVDRPDNYDLVYTPAIDLDHKSLTYISDPDHDKTPSQSYRSPGNESWSEEESGASDSSDASDASDSEPSANK